MLDLLDLGVKAVPTNVEPIASIGLCPGQPSGFVGSFDDERAKTEFDQLPSGGQTSGPCSDNDGIVRLLHSSAFSR